MSLILESWREFQGAADAAEKLKALTKDKNLKQIDNVIDPLLSKYGIRGKWKDRFRDFLLDPNSANSEFNSKSNPPPALTSGNTQSSASSISSNPSYSKEDGEVIATLKKGSAVKPVTMGAALWFAKMVHGETYGGGTEKEVQYMVWSLINRLGRGWWKYELSDYIQAYSQPISRAWADGGSRCSAQKQEKWKQKEIVFKQNSPEKWFYNPCSRARLKKRAEFRALSYSTVNQNILNSVLKLFEGKIPRPPEPVSGWFANFMFEKNANEQGIWSGGEGKGSKLKKVAEVRKNSYYERIDKKSVKVEMIPTNYLNI
tara:strand:- start:42872 stop:43816 length:945 start_codon:yes stop_codon:yes gene_type:complete